MKTIIVTEGPLDAAILRRILGAVVSPRRFDLASAGGKSVAVSLARSLLATRGVPVALVVDADRTDEESVCGKKLILTESLALAGSEDRFGVFLAVPTIEAVFFPSPRAAKALFGDRLTQEDLVAARFEPRQVLRKMLSPSRESVSLKDVEGFMQSHDVRPLAESSLIREIADFLTRNAASPAGRRSHRPAPAQ